MSNTLTKCCYLPYRTYLKLTQIGTLKYSFILKKKIHLRGQLNILVLMLIMPVCI